MSAAGFRARLDRINAKFPPGTVEALEREARARRAERRIRAGIFDADDFAALVEPTASNERETILAIVTGHMWAPYGTLNVRGEAWRAVEYLLTSDPEGADLDGAYQYLVDLANQPPARFNPHAPATHRPVTDSDWLGANMALVVLGPDKGAALRALAAPGVAAARARAEAAHRESMAELERTINGGTAGWVDFYVYFQGQFDEDQATVAVRAAQRRQAREAGRALPLGDYMDYAAEIASTPIGQEPPNNAVAILDRVTKMATPRGEAGHDEWVEANRWRRALGGDWGRRLREHLTHHWQDYLEPL